jgi:hypothetical protein
MDLIVHVNPLLEYIAFVPVDIATKLLLPYVISCQLLLIVAPWLQFIASLEYAVTELLPSIIYLLSPYATHLQSIDVGKVDSFHEIPSELYRTLLVLDAININLLFAYIISCHSKDNGNDLCVHVIASVDVAITEELGIATIYFPSPYAAKDQFALAGKIKELQLKRLEL